MRQYLMELTPLDWGSTALGYSSTFPFELREMENWAKIASAAVDAPGYRRCEDLRALGITFGDYVPTPSTINAGWRDRKEIYLADGGFVDNLAARNLIERGCKSILISDAEHDPSLLFEAYLRLNEDLSKIGQRLVVDEIDQWLKIRGFGTCPKQGPCFQADNPDNPIVQKSAFKGCITKGVGCDSDDEVLARVTYLKLSIDPVKSKAGNLSSHVAAFYAESSSLTPCTARGQDQECSFPHTPTFKTDFRREEFQAYRLLGEDLVRINQVGTKLLEH